jgi:hypothetical protein
MSPEERIYNQPLSTIQENSKSGDIDKTNQYCLTKETTRKSRNALKGVGTNF